MAEYIERERLRESLKNHYYPTDQEYESDRQWAVGYNAGLDRALHSLHYAPAADVAPVVHGRWILRAENSTGLIFQCSACCKFNNPNKKDVEFGRTKEQPDYCPNCGARMDGEG